MAFFRYRKFDSSPILELVAVLIGIGAAVVVASNKTALPGRPARVAIPVFKTKEASRGMTRLTYVDDSDAASHLSRYFGEVLAPDQVKSTVGRLVNAENYDGLEFETWVDPELAKLLADRVLAKAEEETRVRGEIIVPSRAGRWAYTILKLSDSESAVVIWHGDKSEYCFEINRLTGRVLCRDVYDD